MKSAHNNEYLRAKLKVRHLTSQQKLNKFLLSSAIAGTIFLSGPSVASLASSPPADDVNFDLSLSSRQKLLLDINKALPSGLEVLNSDLETKISQILFDDIGLRAAAKLEGERLNRSFGLMGAEQHLPRFPGDTAAQHGQFIQSGITPGLGAWGYVDDPEKEKYYVAVQTLYLPDWQIRFSYLRDWYKYRKMVVINPKNGKVMIVVVADSGPASWTGKHFGGSPEVMAYLDLNHGMQKGPVILFFVDDKNNQVPLGPLETKLNYD